MQFICEATGKPAPNISWTRVLENGSSSEVLHQGSTWDFPIINRTASGTYRCTADNGIGNPDRHKVKVNVTCTYVNFFCTWKLDTCQNSMFVKNVNYKD